MRAHVDTHERSLCITPARIATSGCMKEEYLLVLSGQRIEAISVEWTDGVVVLSRQYLVQSHAHGVKGKRSQRSHCTPASSIRALHPSV